MQTKDIPEGPILQYLADRQGQWSFLWSEMVEAMPLGTPAKLILSKMRNLHKRGLVGGCTCGCRGDFEITDKGLALIGRPRTKPYSGY